MTTGLSTAGIRKEGGEAGGLRLAAADVIKGGPLVSSLLARYRRRRWKKSRDAGGRITREPFGFPGGRRFHFADPSGNEIGGCGPRIDGSSASRIMTVLLRGSAVLRTVTLSKKERLLHDFRERGVDWHI
ncbi:MAG: hypothetical protein U5K38_14385, partial [Woeseiaceae bacterium]|nr:hypothetical protein [Woeseiaceae bacterium]